MNLPNLNGSHSWNFTRTGGIFQAQLNSVEDLKQLRGLDPKLWVALSCPVNDLEIDQLTLTPGGYATEKQIPISHLSAITPGG